ncbi:MocR-like pyridoxine biosynthesis transcription factor PdxR [Butyrivibrio sp. YAB3001]|uniref:MocR-like pyridoxine biosynthesis transcription factor PdxR n=1 Tax=Butyrivibrio sp. YAB3001 TaxID=1520812 RepID=UPI0008F64632|nr:PLP-dependent aminotransferase family protein [Butyrivibrio sp. YAB3001]SFD05995.1 GntR family transcriptional regulator / MocR family aminotransferase [Butyrivibrio sp. YAB3001]
MNATKQYIKIYEEVKEDIIEGRYLFGEKLPSKRVMAERMGVSVITVVHAYELLAEEGYISTREKSGYFITFDDKQVYTGISGVKENNIQNSVKVQVGSNEDTAFSFSIYAKTVRRVLSEYGDLVTEKSPMQGIYSFRKAIADYLARSRRITVDPDQIFVGAGAEYLYGLIVQTFGREIIYGIESPSYQKIAMVYEAGGANIQMLDLGADGVDSEQLWNGPMKVLHITPYRSFPSGVTASAAKKREYLKWSNKRNAYIIEDDFESEFTPSRKPEETLFSIDDSQRVIYVNTFTKTIGSYTRAAYMVVPEKLKDLFIKKVGFYECPVPTIDQLVIAELICSGDFERHINKVRRLNRIKS